jgi:hypothetical protein
MRESVLRDFFVGKVAASDLARDLDTGHSQGKGVEHYSVGEDLVGEFRVSPVHLVKVCDAFLAGNLSDRNLKSIGFMLMSSEHFRWAKDGEEVVSRVADEWAVPEINDPITVENVQKWRRLLIRGGK